MGLTQNLVRTAALGLRYRPCDFFTVPTVTFRALYLFVVLRHKRRQVVHFNITTNPYAEWAAQHIIGAFPYEEAPRFPSRDRDGIYGDCYRERIRSMGIEEVPIVVRSPWQNSYCVRVIGSIRRECLNHVIVFNKRHPYRILTGCCDYYPHSNLWIATHQHHGASNRIPKAKSLRSLKSGDCITDTRVPCDRTHRLVWLVLRYRSVWDGDTARFSRHARLLHGDFLGRHSIRRVSRRLVQLSDGVLRGTGGQVPAQKRKNRYTTELSRAGDH